ncbi:hypothetical protein FOMPIDRAFT_1122783 [Fomitopsis schrenkii]|uniref:Uncharacterized protein n=1 Tax=Fomitopsis schrenkii TaxID=2126942 RepID=S8FG38_FOMSC|nr:hypothetical protein FOMPIDRAFT_1122783 [Fomitopsis schrenkii]
MELNEDNSQNANMLAKSINALGGPDHATEDFAWASSMPQGRSLLEWLSSQIQCQNLVLKGKGPDEAIAYQASLQPIALHDQELLDADSRFCQEESELLEKETRLLKHRLNRSKISARDLAQTNKTLQSEVEVVEREVRLQDAKLSELCINVDNAVTRSARTAENLLQSSETEQSHTSSTRATLATLVRLHDSIVSGAARGLASVDEAIISLPSPAEVHQEAARLLDSLMAVRRQRSRANGIREPTEISIDAYSTHLDKISAALEATVDEKTNRGIIDKFLQEEESSASGYQTDVDVKEEVARAWCIDQQAILHARETVADQTAGVLTEGLLPQLSALRAELAARTAHAVEQEALVSALIEELEEIADDVAGVNVKQAYLAGAHPGADGDAPKKRAHEMLEDGLTELLKRTQGLRPRDAGPLVLLEREDIVKELEAVRERAEGADRAEQAWASNLVPNLAQLSDGHAELLSLVYESAPVNTSPPFGPPSEARTLQGSVKEATEHLNAEVQRLEKETQVNERDKRKLTAFVEKWAR